jgi:hypothetical protein
MPCVVMFEACSQPCMYGIIVWRQAHATNHRALAAYHSQLTRSLLAAGRPGLSTNALVAGTLARQLTQRQQH